ncbi:GATA zinc finger domain-containing protein 8-like [Condylostylus longicornis]|uniref:GATA zinc finger domain-containing protein 8-like n=1 Tax=Condylostylus longicornis TaxID=2530218 RepID=UPI00244E43CE|nr:GATA zinc finger domain-containing protein 8-like [Condylostylus longicornis]
MQVTYRTFLESTVTVRYENAIVPARDRFKKSSQKIKEYAKYENDSIPELNHRYFNAYKTTEIIDSEDSDNIIRRKTNHSTSNTLKRVKNNKKIEKPNSSNPSVNRLQIVHNIDGYDNVFHTQNTFDIKEISELKANSSQTTKDIEILHNNSSLNYDDNKPNYKISHQNESIKNNKDKVKTTTKSNYQLNNPNTSVALEKQSRYNDGTNNFNIDLSMDFSQSIKSSVDSARDYCVLFDSVIDWLRTTRHDQHIYYNFDYDDSMFSIKNIPSRTNYDSFGYNYLTATTSATITTTTNSDKSYKNQHLDENNKEIVSGNSKFYRSTSKISDKLHTENDNAKQCLSQPQVNDSITNTPQHNLHSNLSQVYSHCDNSETLSPTTKNFCLPYEFSNDLNISRDIESVHLYSSTEQQVICTTGGSVNNNNNNNKNNKRTVNVNSRQETRNQMKKQQQNQQYKQLKSEENHNILHQKQQQIILNEPKKNSQLPDTNTQQGDSENTTQTTVFNNSFITCSSSGSTCSGSSTTCSSSSSISELNDEYTRHMQRSKRRAIYLKPDDETVHQLQLNYHRDNINFSDNLLLQPYQSNELKNEISSTLADTNFSVSENTNINNSNNVNSTSDKFESDLTNTSESILKYRDLESEESALCNNSNNRNIFRVKFEFQL